MDHKANSNPENTFVVEKVAKNYRDERENDRISVILMVILWFALML